MGGKDIAGRTLLDRNEVFADVMNVVVFGGEERVLPQELEAVLPRSQYKMAGIRSQERDVLKLWRGVTFRVAFVGMELQSRPDPYMAIRAMSYDAAKYRGQLAERERAVRRGGEPEPIAPVVTVVLYLGYAEPWGRRRRLLDCIGAEIPDYLRPLVQDYGTNVYEVAWLDDAARAKFKTGFAVVAEYLYQMRTAGRYDPADVPYDYMEDVLDLLSAMTGDGRFEEYYDAATMAGRKVSMCEFIDRYEKKGWNEGIRAGRDEGIRMANTDRIRSLMRNGNMGADKAMALLGIGEAERPAYAALLK